MSAQVIELWEAQAKLRAPKNPREVLYLRREYFQRLKAAFGDVQTLPPRRSTQEIFRDLYPLTLTGAEDSEKRNALIAELQSISN